MLGIARNGDKQQQEIHNRMSGTYITKDFVQNFASSSIPYNH